MKMVEFRIVVEQSFFLHLTSDGILVNTYHVFEHSETGGQHVGRSSGRISRRSWAGCNTPAVVSLDTRVLLDSGGYTPPGAGVVAVDIDVTLPLSPSWGEIDVLGAISPQDPYVGYVSDWEDPSHGFITRYDGRYLFYDLYSYADQSKYEATKQEYEGKIDAWAQYHADRIDAEYDQQRSALTMLQGFLEEQDQAESFWEHLSGAAGAGSFLTGPYGIAFTLASAAAAVISMHASDPAPNFTSYWGDMVNKLATMQALEMDAIASEATRMKSMLIADLPPAVALTTDQFDYLFQNYAGQLSVGTITVNLGGRIDYYARLQGLHNNFSSWIEPVVYNPYRPVHRAQAVYGDALLGYATSRGWSMHIDVEEFDPYGSGEVIWDPHWQSDEGLEWPFTFGPDDIASELTSINFMLPGFEVYLDLP